jgi:hypothetical protein
MTITNIQRAELLLRPNLKAIIHLPGDLTKKEGDLLKCYIDLSTNIRRGK